LNRRNVRQSERDVVEEWYGETPGRTAEVVAATNGSAATIDRQFDLVVIDEATQATIAASSIPLARADTAVLAGDNKQLPPFSKTETPPKEAVGRSLFEHLYADGGVYEDVGLQLRTQYRMHRDIAYFPNREFYDRSLRTGLDIDPLEEWDPILGYDIGGGERRCGTSFVNPTEASFVARLVDRITAAGVPAAEVGVITPYAAQVHCICDELHTQSGVPNGEAVTVDTIDAFQGSERTVILISLVRSNADGQIGFLGRPADGPRRLNVAMTRAERLCVLVGDWTTLTDDSHDGDIKLYDKLASFLRDTGRMREFDAALL
jgi:superfamily I DNA and/or RNA helicase